MIKLVQLLLFCLASISVLGQGRHIESERKIVLAQKRIGKNYIFDHSRGDRYDRTELIYLGKIKTSTGRIIKVLTYRWYWGLGPRATSRILIYDNNDRYLGNYYTDMTTYLPVRIEKNSLVFQNSKDCQGDTINRISFRYKIPAEFYTSSSYFKFE